MSKLNLLTELGREIDALKLARALRERQPSDPYPLANIVQLLHRPETIDELRSELAKSDYAQLVGSVEQRAVVIRGMRAVGDLHKASLHAYNLACEAPQNEAAVAALAFMPLAEMFAGRSEGIFPQPTTVGIDCFVELKSKSGEVHRFIVGKGAEVFGTPVHDLGHPLVIPIVGQRSGYRFSHRNPFDFSEDWSIEAVESKQSYLCRKLLNEWNVRFPTSRMMGSLKMQEGDVSPLLELARRGDSKERLLVEAHATSVFPLSLCARALGTDPINFAQRVRRRGQWIRTRNGGIRHENETALRLGRGARGKGIVLDPFTTITAAAMGVLSPLKSYFGKLYITGSVSRLLDSLERDAHVGTGVAARDLLLAASLDLKSIGTETELEAVSYLRNSVNQHCITELGLLPDDPPPKLVEAVNDWGVRVMDTASLAIAKVMPILSDDFAYRAVVNELSEVGGIWLEPALRLCYEDNIITEAEHVSCLGQISSLKLGRPPVSIRNMMVAFESGLEDGFRDFKALALQIGGPDVYMFSHTHFASILFRNLWDRHISRSPLKVRIAVGLVLGRLVHRKESQWWIYISSLLALSKPRGALQKCIVLWLRGHFYVDARGAPILRGDRHERRRMLDGRSRSSRSQRAAARVRGRNVL
ncbi:PIN domain-containing protein [Methylobacterium brachiatum]